MEDNTINEDELNEELIEKEESGPSKISEMYKQYFLDYASYVILERAIPSVYDGLKPVQRRILHAMKMVDDGRYNKVANIIGQTMQYHPHGDAAIGDALVGIGQKDMLIDCQGNWGDIRTGDRAAAARYIEARLSKFALEIAFNAKTTNFQLSYDGRKKEPINLPVKFPLLLLQGVEGIAVGLSTKILPHNFVELVKGAIQVLKGKKTNLMPDFLTKGKMDCSNYNGGKKGGKVRVRACIEQIDKKMLGIKEIPYGTTTTGIIDSILKASAKNKFKVKKVVDNTAADVEILIELPTGASPEMTIDALYAFSDCEVSISPNACVIQDDKPIFISVNELLEMSVQHTKDLLHWELLNRKNELEDRWHFASLEKIFISNKIYQDIEECESWEEVVTTIDKGLQPHIKHLKREIVEEDIVRLTEIRIKRISKYNSFKADELLKQLEEDLAQVEYDIANLTDFAINYFKELLKKYGKGRERKTEITRFDNIDIQSVVVNNAKLYINRKEGFMGYGLKKDEYIEECSDIDDVIVFYKDGSYKVVKIGEKVFVGKNIIHIAVWRKKDERLIYNAVYADLEKGINFIKRFSIPSVTRDRVYPIAKGVNKSKILHFTANKNGEAETIGVLLTSASTAKRKEFEFDFADLAVKGRTARGNTLTRYPIRKIKVVAQGVSTLGAIKVYYDETTGRLNNDGYGQKLGEFEDGDTILAVYDSAMYEMTSFELTNRFDAKELIELGQLDKDKVISCVYYDGERKATYIKRFVIETSTLNQRFDFLPNRHRSTKMLGVTLRQKMKVEYKVRAGKKSIEGQFNIEDFSVKGWKSLGNKLSDYKLSNVGFQEIKEEDAGEE